MADHSPAANSPVRFGVFELDPATGHLRKHGVRVKLQGQPFAVLLILLEKPGQLVTRDPSNASGRPTLSSNSIRASTMR